ncbi:MAG TPA: F0F1 ATP synthase subunit epsilon [Terriglobia bacterium]|nr:F0F1 ATP synthase subunit epsilon [Terriglobia bacterium]
MADALPTQLHLEIVTPDHQVARESVSGVSIPGKNGYLGILPGHAPLLSELQVGELSYVHEGLTHHLAVSWGFAEVLPDRVIILAETAERAEEIDIERAEQAKQRAEERLKKLTDPEIDMERARAALDRALTRLQVSRHAKQELA